MRKAIKNKGKIVSAYELGAGSAMECKLIKEGKIVLHADGKYELYSKEAVNGSGQIAQKGDYFKLSADGFPYPNDRSYFIENHRHLEADTYEQKVFPQYAWSANDEMCPEIQFLIDNRGLVLDKTNPGKYFNAPLWGTDESAPIDAVLMFYDITYNTQNEICDATFNFVAIEDFTRDYSWID